MASEVPAAAASTTDGKGTHYVPEPEMTYAPPEYHNLPEQQTPVPAHEVAPRYVTPLAQLQSVPKEVDCPYCRQVVMTKVHLVDTSGSDMMCCLIYLVCWPLLFCYEPDKDTDHHCSKCGKQLTHQPHGGATSVVAQPPNASQPLVVSAFGHGGEVSQQQPQQQPQQQQQQAARPAEG